MANCNINHNFHVIFWKVMAFQFQWIWWLQMMYESMSATNKQTPSLYAKEIENCFKLECVALRWKTHPEFIIQKPRQTVWYANWVINIFECHTIADLIMMAFSGRVSLTQKSKITFHLNSFAKWMRKFLLDTTHNNKLAIINHQRLVSIHLLGAIINKSRRRRKTKSQRKIETWAVVMSWRNGVYHRCLDSCVNCATVLCTDAFLHFNQLC